MKIAKSINVERREFIAPVLVPEEVDYHGDIYSEEEVYNACRNYRKNCGRASLQHKFDLSTDTAEFVEHYVTPGEMTVIDPAGEEVLVKKGTWMASMKIKDDSLWDDCQNDVFTGFSISASCWSEKLQKSKTAGSKAAEEGIVARKRLFDMDFSQEEHHVSLVDEAANATRVLAMKAKTQKSQEGNMPTPEEIEAAKEAAIKAKLEAERKEEAAVKAKEQELEDLKKSKADADAELETLRKAKEQAEIDKVELEDLRKARDAKEREELVCKAKAVKADDAEVFADVLKKCKGALEDTEYETLVKQLEKLENIDKNEELLKNVGQNTGDSLKKSVSDRVFEKRSKFIEEGMRADLAIRKARLEVEAEDSAASK